MTPAAAHASFEIDRTNRRPPATAGVVMSDLEVRLAGTETVVLEVPGVEIVPNRVLTVFAIGLVAGDPPLSVLASLDAKCFVDLDDNGAIDIADAVRFAELYATRDPSLDFDRNGVVNRTDAFIFLEKWQVSDEVCDC